MIRILPLLLVVACQPALVRVRVDVSQAALSFPGLKTLTVDCKGDGVSTGPVNVDIATGSVDLPVPYGNARTFTVTARTDAGVVALFGRTTVDLPRSEPVIDLTLPVFSAGEIEAELVTSDNSALPALFALSLQPGFDAAAQADGAVVRFISYAGDVGLTGSYDPGYALLAPRAVKVGQGERVKAKLFFGPKGSKCAASNPAELLALAPACRKISVSVAGTAGAAFSVHNGAALLPLMGDGDASFTEAVQDGDSYELVFGDLPAGMQCTATPASGIVSADVSASVSCGFTVAVHLGGLYSGQLTATVGNEALLLSGDGTFDTNAVYPGGSTVASSITQPAGPHCTVAPSLVGINATHRTVNIGCAAPLVSAGDLGVYLDSTGSGACNPGLAPRYDDCIHAGERRSTTLSDLTDCTGVSAHDELDVMSWRCVPSAFGVNIQSVRFKGSHGVADVIDWASCSAPGTCSYLPNALHITEPSGTRDLPASVWWSTPIMASVAGGEFGASGPTASTPRVVAVVGPTSSTIINSSAPFRVLRAQDSHQTVVVKPGKHMEFNAATMDGQFNWLEGTMSSTSSTSAVSVTLSGNHSRWQDVHIDIGGAHLVNADANRVQGLYVDASVLSAPPAGLQMAIASRIDLVGLRIYRAADGIINDLSCVDDHFHDVRIAQSLSSGMNITGARHWFSLIRVYESAGLGIFEPTNATLDSIFVNVITASNDNDGFRHIDYMAGSGHFLGHSLFAANNGVAGMQMATSVAPSGWFADQHNLAAIDNEGFGFKVLVDQPYRLLTAASLHNSTAGTGSAYQFADFVDLGGNILIDNVNGCDNASAGAGGVIFPATCTQSGADGSSVWQKLQSAVLRTGREAISSYVGQVKDTNNPVFTNVANVAATGLTNVAAWTSFSNDYRTIMSRGAIFPSGASRGRCTSNCQVFDWRLQTGADLAGVNPVPTIADLDTHSWYGNTACSTTYPGSTLLNGKCATRFLRYAIEVYGDDVGNDNGLCEPGEHCVYTPHVGPWQGDGPLLLMGMIATDPPIELYQHQTPTL